MSSKENQFETSKGFIRIDESENNDLFWELLQRIKDSNILVSSLYSKELLAYYRQSFDDRSSISINKSFILCQDSKPYFAFIGVLSTSTQVRSLMAYQLPCLILESKLLTNTQKKNIKISLSELINISCDNYLIGSCLGLSNIQFSMDYLLTQLNTKSLLNFKRIINLKQSEDSLKNSVRRRYRSSINWGLREMEINIYDSKNITKDIISNFRKLHIREAGRETRSLNTWDRQYDSILAGSSFCITGIYKGEFVSAGWFPISDRHCFYGVSASRRDLFEKPLFHAIFWKAILKAKELNAVAFETYEVYKHGEIRPPTDKEKQISHFLSGFGGSLIPAIYSSS